MGVKCHQNLWKLIKSCVLGVIICFHSFSALVINQTFAKRKEREYPNYTPRHGLNIFYFISFKHTFIVGFLLDFQTPFLTFLLLFWQFNKNSNGFMQILCEFVLNKKSVWYFSNNYISETDNSKTFLMG